MGNTIPSDHHGSLPKPPTDPAHNVRPQPEKPVFRECTMSTRSGETAIAVMLPTNLSNDHARDVAHVVKSAVQSFHRDGYVERVTVMCAEAPSIQTKPARRGALHAEREAMIVEGLTDPLTKKAEDIIAAVERYTRLLAPKEDDLIVGASEYRPEMRRIIAELLSGFEDRNEEPVDMTVAPMREVKLPAWVVQYAEKVSRYMDRTIPPGHTWQLAGIQRRDDADRPNVQLAGFLDKTQASALPAEGSCILSMKAVITREASGDQCVPIYVDPAVLNNRFLTTRFAN